MLYFYFIKFLLVDFADRVQEVHLVLMVNQEPEGKR